MVRNPTRRNVIGIVTGGLASIPGCVEYFRSGCEKDSEYLLILTAVEPEAVRTEPIDYASLSAPERRLIEEALDGGRYEVCPHALSETESQAFYEFGDRVRESSESGYAFLEYEGRYFQVGLILSAVHYARTEH